ncbi:MAG: peptidase M23 [Burkholderiales bacterium RIFCSPLOWO2_12_FULL_61_40]|nr:MAG: peptidase M23 [Burkholderiales bacterium RIFCSPLOWO2_12_FULL_61_40]
MIHGLTQFAEECFTFAAQLVKRHPQRTTALITALLLGGTGATFAVANLAPDASDLPVQTLVESVQTLPVQAQTAAVQALAMRLYRSDTTRSTDTAETLLKRMGVFDPQAAAFLRADTQTQQVLLGRAGRNVTVEASETNTLLALSARWSPEDDGMFKRLTVENTPAGFRSRVETLPLTASSRLASGTIRSSLFAATDDARIPDAIAIQLAEIFSGDIDFHRALRKGDRFSVVYETLEGDGEPMRAGRVLSAEFVNAGKTHQAMWFQDPLAKGGTTSATATPLTKGGYYTLAGQSLRRAFLASPMEFSRITSGFKMRFHPILKAWRAHNGVDYAAPTGTPVRSIGDGVVEFAGVKGGYGNVVVVKHSNSDSTAYAHLSRINVKRGEPVSQGQRVGAVGSTGWATGPHLHFEFRVNGVFRDPLSMASRNETLPVSASARPLFDKTASQVRTQLAAAAHMQVGTAQ